MQKPYYFTTPKFILITRYIFIRGKFHGGKLLNKKILLGLICSIIIVTAAYTLCLESELPDEPIKTPQAELTVEKDNDYIVTIKSIDFEVASTNVSFGLCYLNSGTVPNVGFNFTDPYDPHKRYSIADIEPGDPRKNITYYDSDNDDNLSVGDLFVLETDWDGPDNDANADGNLTNDGPVEDRQHFILLYTPTGSHIASRYLVILPTIDLTVENNGDYIVKIESIEFGWPVEEILFAVGQDNYSYIPYVGILPPDYPEKHPGGEGEITRIEPGEPRMNITYYDNDQNNLLSENDTFVLEADWDGSDNDANGDGDFTNDGPVTKHSWFRLNHELGGYTFASIELV